MFRYILLDFDGNEYQSIGLKSCDNSEQHDNGIEIYCTNSNVVHAPRGWLFIGSNIILFKTSKYATGKYKQTVNSVRIVANQMLVTWKPYELLLLLQHQLTSE